MRWKKRKVKLKTMKIKRGLTHPLECRREKIDE